MEDLEKLFVIYEAALLKECWKYYKQQADVWDLYQDSAIKMSAGFDNFDGARNFMPWARKIIRRTFIDRKRAEDVEFKGIDVVNRANLEPYIHIDADVQEKITELLVHLPKEEAELLVAVYVNGITQEQIANYFNVTQQAVSKRLKKACKSLREVYDEYFGYNNRSNSQRST